MSHRCVATTCLVVLTMFSIGAGSARAAPFAYVGNADDGTVSVVDLATNAVVTTVATGPFPAGSAVSQNRSLVFITNYDGRTVSVISAGTQSVVATVPMPAKPFGIAVNPAGTHAYVSLSNGTVAVIDALTNTVVANFPVGSTALEGIAVDAAGTFAYVADFSAQSIRVVDLGTRQVVASVALASRPFALALHPAGRYLYVTTQGSNAGGHALAVVDTTTNTLVATVPTGGVTPLGLAVHPSGTSVYVATTNFVANTSSVLVFDTATNTFAGTVVTPLPGSFTIGFHPDGSRAYLTNSRTNVLLVIDTAARALSASIPVGRMPGTVGDFIVACAIGQALSAGTCVAPGDRIVEYINTVNFPSSPGGHFFYTSDPAEQAAIDAGGAGLFVRTGAWFRPGGTKPLCRFYGSVAPGPNSHFFTIDDAECAALKAAQVMPTPAAVQQWNYEGLIFSETPPLIGAGGALSCPAGTVPVYRYYNNAFRAGVRNPWDSNHRYGTEKAALDAYAAAHDWNGEGIVFCASP